MKKKSISLSLIILLLIFITGCKKDIVLVNERHIGKTLVTFDGGKITSGDLASYKKYRKDNISDKQALEIVIEKELLYKEAKKQHKTATLEEAKAEADKQKSMYEKYSTQQDRKETQDILMELNISEKEYWNDYCPKAFRKLITIVRMKNFIRDKLYADIIKNHSDWGKKEIEKGYEELYTKKINDLRTKFHLKYIEL